MKLSPSRVTSAARPSRVKRGLTRARLVVAQAHHARGRDGLALDREHRHGALGAVRHERERALPVDRHARRALACLQRRDHRRRRGAEIHDAEAVIGHGLGGVGRILLGGRGHERQPLIRRDRHAHRRTDHAAGHRDLREHLRRRHAEIDDRDGVGRGVGHYLDHPVVEHDLVVVRRDGPLRQGAGRQSRGRSGAAAGARSGANRVVSWVPPLGCWSRPSRGLARTILRRRRARYRVVGRAPRPITRPTWGGRGSRSCARWMRPRRSRISGAMGAPRRVVWLTCSDISSLVAAR